MTTTIPIRTTAHKAVSGQYLKAGTSEPIGDPTVVDKDSSTSMYLHGGQDLLLHEMTEEEYEGWRATQPAPGDESDPDDPDPENEDDDPPE